MLILTRRTGETITIGDNITLTVLGVVGNQVRVGINAPKNVPVHREEIYQRIKRENNGGPVVTLEEQRPGWSREADGGPPDHTLKLPPPRERVEHSPRCDCQLCIKQQGGRSTKSL